MAVTAPEDGFVRGRRLGVDVGTVRVGVAVCDPDGLVATPVETVPRGPGDLDRLAALAAEHEAVAVVVGLPRSLSGRLGPAAVSVTEFAAALVVRLGQGSGGTPVRLVDERLTTVAAERTIRDRVRGGRKRRAVIDQVAAVLILQTAMDTERTTGAPAGREVGTT